MCLYFSRFQRNTNQALPSYVSDIGNRSIAAFRKQPKCPLGYHVSPITNFLSLWHAFQSKWILPNILPKIHAKTINIFFKMTHLWSYMTSMIGNSLRMEESGLSFEMWKLLACENYIRNVKPNLLDINWNMLQNKYTNPALGTVFTGTCFAKMHQMSIKDWLMQKQQIFASGRHTYEAT